MPMMEEDVSRGKVKEWEEGRIIKGLGNELPSSH